MRKYIKMVTATMIAVSLASRLVEHEYPVAAGGLEERAARYERSLLRLAES